MFRMFLMSKEKEENSLMRTAVLHITEVIPHRSASGALDFASHAARYPSHIWEPYLLFHLGPERERVGFKQWMFLRPCNLMWYGFGYSCLVSCTHEQGTRELLCLPVLLAFLKLCCKRECGTSFFCCWQGSGYHSLWMVSRHTFLCLGRPCIMLTQQHVALEKEIEKAFEHKLD